MSQGGATCRQGGPLGTPGGEGAGHLPPRAPHLGHSRAGGKRGLHLMALLWALGPCHSRALVLFATTLTSFPDFRAVDLIRHGGKKMRFLVAKSDVDTAKKIRFRSPPP